MSGTRNVFSDCWLAIRSGSNDTKYASLGLAKHGVCKLVAYEGEVKDVACHVVLAARTLGLRGYGDIVIDHLLHVCVRT